MRNLFFVLVLANLAFAAWHSWFSKASGTQGDNGDVPTIMLASEFPVCPARTLDVVALPCCVPIVFGVPREFENGAVKLKMPVGEGGCRTLRRSPLKSNPTFNE